MVSLFRDQKKGTVGDLFVVIIVLFTLGATIVVGWTLFNAMVTGGVFAGSTQSAQVATNTLDQFGIWDNAFLAALVVLSLTSVVAAARVRTSPLFFGLSLILLAIVLLVGLGVSTMFEDLTEGAPLSASESAFPKIFFIMDNLVYYLLIMAVLITIALYSFRGQSLI